MTTLVVDVHLGRFVVVELLPDVGLVLGCEAGPGLVRPPVVLVARRHLDVVVELDDLKRQKTWSTNLLIRGRGECFKINDH